jgi:hypothetical protein
VYHYSARESRLVGRSIAETNAIYATEAGEKSALTDLMTEPGASLAVVQSHLDHQPGALTEDEWRRVATARLTAIEKFRFQGVRGPLASSTIVLY